MLVSIIVSSTLKDAHGIHNFCNRQLAIVTFAAWKL